MPHALDTEPWYNPERDGNLDDYVAAHFSETAPPLFQGYSQYETLKDQEFLQPGVTGIRLMWGSMRIDESYIVTDDFKLKGLPGVFCGKGGVHDAKDILKNDGPPWIASGLRVDEEKVLAVMERQRQERKRQ